MVPLTTVPSTVWAGLWQTFPLHLSLLAIFHAVTPAGHPWGPWIVMILYFLVPRVVPNNRPQLKIAHGYMSRDAIYFFPKLATMQENSFSGQIPAIELKLARTMGSSWQFFFFSSLGLPALSRFTLCWRHWVPLFPSQSWSCELLHNFPWVAFLLLKTF